MAESNEKLVFMVLHGPQHPEHATIPFVMACAALASDVQVVLGFQADGVCLVHKGEAETVEAAGFPPLAKLMSDFRELGGTLLCQKDAFLCAAKGVSLGIAFQRKLGVGLFGGEGFIMQKLDGDGLAFIHAGGMLMERTLAPGETLRVDTGCIAALAPSVNFDIQYVGKLKSALFGGEGLFFATLTGPGKIWLQSLPFSRLAGRIWMAAPQGGGRQVGEGSILGGLGGLLDGDNG